MSTNEPSTWVLRQARGLCDVAAQKPKPFSCCMASEGSMTNLQEEEVFGFECEEGFG